MASEELKYIKEIGIEIAKLNSVIREKDEKITRLVEKIGDKDEEIAKLETTVNNLKNLYNEVYYRQSDLRRERDKYEKRFIAISETLMCILPEFGKEVTEDIEKDFMSKVLDRIEDKERLWW